MIDDSTDDITVELNLDNEYVRQLLEFERTAPPMLVAAWWERQHRRAMFEHGMAEIGPLSKFRRRAVVRAMVRMFRAGCRSGRLAAIREGELQIEQEGRESHT